MCVYLRTKFQVSSIILTSFRQRGGVILHPAPPLNKSVKSPPRLGLTMVTKNTKRQSQICKNQKQKQANKQAKKSFQYLLCQLN